MVSLWPFRGEDTSPASFEKTLSALSTKIANASAKLDSRRQRSRRFKALWTLYSSFAYLLYVMIVALVVGWRSWGATEYSAIAGGPLVIYLVRLSLTTYYDYRISNLQAHVNSIQKQRETTITKLKAATRYDSTQQLLEKYGGTPSKSKSTEKKPGPGSEKKKSPNVGRTGFVPPPTANIPSRNIPTSMPNTPQRSSPMSPLGPNPPLTAAAASPPWQQPGQMTESAEFAPNAFSGPSYAQPESGPNWYDRFLDVLLGEDEANPRNRLALICSNCRLVNGLAPPGARQLEDVGRWRCAGCGTMNGVESEAKRIVAEIKEGASTSIGTSKPKDQNTDDEVVLVGADDGQDSDVTQYSDEEPNKRLGDSTTAETTAQEIPEKGEAKAKRGRPKEGSKKK